MIGSEYSQVGPSHHKSCLSSSSGSKPREAQSAGFSRVGTCLGGRCSKMLAILLPTNVLNLRELPSSQWRTMVLSHQANVSVREILRFSLVECNNLANKDAPQSSMQGTDCFFGGATLVLAVTKDTVGGPSV